MAQRPGIRASHICIGKLRTFAKEELNLFNWLNRSMAAAADGGVKSSNMDRAEKQRNYDLRLSVNEAEGELRAAWAELESVRWHRPEEVHLIYVEDDLEVLITCPLLDLAVAQLNCCACADAALTTSCLLSRPQPSHTSTPGARPRCACKFSIARHHRVLIACESAQTWACGDDRIISSPCAQLQRTGRQLSSRAVLTGIAPCADGRAGRSGDAAAGRIRGRST